MKPRMSKFISTVQSTLSKHSPEILLGIGIAGMITTTVLAVKATPKALKKIEAEKEKQQVDKLKAKDVVKATWKCYIPAAVTGATSTACLIGANSVHVRRSAALATAYKLSETAFTEYKDKVVETVGERKEKAIKDEIAKDKIERDPVQNSEVIMTDKGQTLCYDGLSGRYFYSDRDAIQRAVNNINRKIVVHMYISLNEFYSELGLEPIKVGADLGWNIDDGEIEVEYSAQLATDGRPCMVIEYNVVPKYKFDSFM